VARALARNGGKRMKTCRELEISKDTLRRMIRRCQDMGEF
jgi:transcriptional regulator with PAS, ATPase and Fis domain